MSAKGPERRRPRPPRCGRGWEAAPPGRPQPTTRNAVDDDWPVVPSAWYPTANSGVASEVAIAVRRGNPAPPVPVPGSTDQALPFQCATAGAPAASAPDT